MLLCSLIFLVLCYLLMNEGFIFLYPTIMCRLTGKHSCLAEQPRHGHKRCSDRQPRMQRLQQMEKGQETDATYIYLRAVPLHVKATRQGKQGEQINRQFISARAAHRTPHDGRAICLPLHRRPRGEMSFPTAYTTAANLSHAPSVCCSLYTHARYFSPR